MCIICFCFYIIRQFFVFCQGNFRIFMCSLTCKNKNKFYNLSVNNNLTKLLAVFSVNFIVKSTFTTFWHSNGINFFRKMSRKSTEIVLGINELFLTFIHITKTILGKFVCIGYILAAIGMKYFLNIDLFIFFKYFTITEKNISALHCKYFTSIANVSAILFYNFYI